MKKKRNIRVHHEQHPIRWLPIDSRFITPIFKFGNVKGISRIFLEIEITFAILIVIGTFIVAGVKFFNTLVK